MEKPFLKILRKYFKTDYNKYKLVNYCNILNNTTVVINITNECKVNLVFGYGDIYSDGYINLNCIENYLDIIYNYVIEKLQKGIKYFFSKKKSGFYINSYIYVECKI